MGSRNWEMGNKKAKTNLPRKGVKEKVNKVTVIQAVRL
jgi:hypothetical protein